MFILRGCVWILLLAASVTAIAADAGDTLPRSSSQRLEQRLQALGRFDEAIECLSDALRVNPNLPDAHVALGEIAERAGRRTDAMAHYEKALSLRPHDPGALIGIQRLKAADHSRAAP